MPPAVAAMVWMAGCGMIDWLTGPELSISAMFYLPAIILVAWLSNLRTALIICLVAALIWLATELAFNRVYTDPYIPYWNAFIRLAFFVITVLLVSEIKSRRRTEAALAAQDSILSSILNSMRDGVVVVDTEGLVIGFNPAAEKVFGINPIGRNADQWVKHLESTRLDGFNLDGSGANVLRLATSGRLSGDREFSMRSANEDEPRILRVTAQPLLGKFGTQAGVVVVIANLTARRTMEMRIAEATEREQRRIGQDLHDGVCQHLVSVAFAAGGLQGHLESLSLESEARDAGKIATLINDAITEVRDLAHGLYPAGLEDGIEVALQTLANSTRERTGILCSAKVDDVLPALDPMTTVHLYRIAQECISNACRHGIPDAIGISLQIHDQTLKLIVTDNGKGMEISSPPRGIGLNLMRYRANMMGGNLEIDTSPNRGTTVTCTLPPSSVTLLHPR
ncbi:MAG: ATP-binding protein [Luteolibacter sp.]